MSLFHDVRLALRLLRRNPLTTAIALLSTTLSIGATAVVFTAVKAVLLDPLPYSRPSELIQIRSDTAHAAPSLGDWVFPQDALEIARRSRTLASVAMYGNSVLDLPGDGGAPPEAHYGLRVSPNLFPTLGVTPMLGRTPEVPGELLLSYGMWRARFHADRRIVGHPVAAGGRTYTVTGVMPERFNFPMRRDATHTPAPYVEFWEILQLKPAALTTSAVGAVARLRPGVSLDSARQEIASIGTDLARDFAATNRDRTLSAAALRDSALGKARPALWVLFGAAGLFLVIGCANVANLLLARGLARRRELAVRMAMGAGRLRIARQLLTESCVLAGLGGLGGFLLAALAWRLLPAIAPANIPRLTDAHAGLSVLAFSLAIALANGIAFGIAPAMRGAGSGDFAARSSLASPRDRLRGALVAAEVAIAVVLVVAGGQLLTSFVSLVHTNPGFNPDHVFAAVVLAAPDRYPTPASRGEIYSKFLDAVRAIPGVDSAGTADALPFSGENHGGFLAPGVVGEIDVVSPDYLQTLGARLKSGRWLTAEDMRPDSDAVLVSDAVPADSSICLNCTPEHPSNWKRVVGVVASMHHSTLDGAGQPAVYLAAAALQRAQFIVARTSRPPKEMERAIRRAIAGVDPQQPVLLGASMRTLIGDTVAGRRFLMSLLAATAALALMLAAGGIYGVTAYTTSRRTQEIGIRMALGATPGRIHALVFGQSFTAVAAGLALGALGSVLGLKLLGGLLWGLAATPVAAPVIAATLVLATAALACWLPARRAMSVDPNAALRNE